MANTKISALPAKTALIEGDYFPIIDSSDISNKRATLKNVQKSIFTNIKFIETSTDFPAAIAGVITLVDNVTYFITGDIDLAGDRIVAGQNTTIIGGSSENCKLRSTGLNASTALLSSAWSLPLKNITITHGTALDLDATANANQALDWLGVNFTDCANVGTIAAYTNFIATDCGFLNSGNMTFDGTIGTVGFISCIFDAAPTTTSLIIPATATITRRFRVVYSAFVALSGETAINVSTSASIPVEGYILAACNFSGGGSYTVGVQFDDNKSLFQNCRGVSNTTSVANFYMRNNATVTDIVTQDIPVKVAGTTTAGTISKFSHANNRATYLGSFTQNFTLTATISCTAGNNHQVGVYFAKNGSLLTDSETYSTTSGSGRAENVSIQAVTSLSTNDYIEVWIENATNNTDITVTFLNVIVSII